MIRAAGLEGAVRVVDHEDPDAFGELVPAVERERGPLDALVNDIFGGDRYAQWDKPLWEYDRQGGLRTLQVGVHTHLHHLPDGDPADAAHRRRALPTAGNATTAQASSTSGSGYDPREVIVSTGKHGARSTEDQRVRPADRGLGQCAPHHSGRAGPVALPRQAGRSPA